ncbi:MAG: efflux RND transporter periplasmic adaptor subunit [Anaerolineales bacterium]|nr:efflux RND transporter periplasmic adaptor subunit [Anaerolineales bacterium]
MNQNGIDKQAPNSGFGKRFQQFFTKHPIDTRKRIIILVVFVVVLGGWYFISQWNYNNNNVLKASGIVEAEDVVMAPELSGKVVEIMAEKGEKVSAGDPLFRLGDEMLQAQRNQAAAALQSAQANLAAAENGIVSAEVAQKTAQINLEVARANTEAARLPVQKSLDDLTINAAAARGEAARNVAAANRAVRDATYYLDNYLVSSLQENFTPAEGISVTQKLLNQARTAFEPYRNDSIHNDRRQDLKEALDNAQSEYDSAVRRIELEAALEAAETQLRKAEDDLAKLQDGPNPQDVAILEANLAAIDAVPKQAEVQLEAAQNGVETARSQLKAAKAAVAQAQAALDLIDLQIRKLTVVSPIDGVVLSSSVEVGEVIQASSSAMTVGKLSTLKITVYLPEYRIGEVSLGQITSVTVDSFPDEKFQAAVVYISDKAEFTPRNVQTVEGRRNTVFAIELSIENEDGRLKPGMPADVSFIK